MDVRFAMRSSAVSWPDGFGLDGAAETVRRLTGSLARYVVYTRNL